MDKINLKRESWNKPYKNGVVFNQKANLKILEIINNINNKDIKVLDIGCGAGELSIFLNDANYNVTGIDISDVAIDKAKTSVNEKRNEKEGIKFLIGDIFDVKEKYDVMVCKLVYAFIENKKTFLNKVKSILNEGGIFIISTPVITLENKDKVLKPAICVSEQDIDVLKDYFTSINIEIESVDNYGDNYIITCYR